MFKLDELPTEEEIAVFSHEFPACHGDAVMAFLTVMKKGSLLLEALDRYLQPFGFLHGRFIALVVLQRNGKGEESASQLAAKLGIAKPTLTRMLASLESEALVEIRPCEKDRRNRYIRITKQGLKKLKEVMPGYYDLINHLLGDFSEKELIKITQLLNKIKEE
ncbi:MAG: winged helix-turn-helix transcriptional regulator [Myxococcales bacterium]|nr:winged helix-turn-helix transcriptional regulator [Myxococcales bacterium]